MLNSNAPTVATEPDQPLTLKDALRFVGRNVLWIVSGAVLAGCLATLLLVISAHSVYETGALLEVRREQIAGPLGDETVPAGHNLPARGYLLLAKAPDTLLRLRQILTRSTAADAPDFSRSDLSASLVLPERWEGRGSFLVQLQGRASSADRVATIVNAWAEALIEVDSRLAVTSALETANRELVEDLGALATRRTRLEAQLEILRKEREKIPAILTLRTSSLRSQGGITGSAERPEALLSEEPNPVYVDLTSKMTSLQLALATLATDKEGTENDLQLVRDRLRTVDTLSASGFEPPESETSSASSADSPPKPGEPARTDDQAQTQVRPLSPPFGALTRRALAAESPIHLIEPAAVPPRVQPTHRVPKILAATVGGAILGFLIAVGRSALYSPRPRTSARS